MNVEIEEVVRGRQKSFTTSYCRYFLIERGRDDDGGEQLHAHTKVTNNLTMMIILL
jgi:hypothetical protein